MRLIVVQIIICLNFSHTEENVAVRNPGAKIDYPDAHLYLVFISFIQLRCPLITAPLERIFWWLKEIFNKSVGFFITKSFRIFVDVSLEVFLIAVAPVLLFRC